MYAPDARLASYNSGNTDLQLLVPGHILQIGVNILKILVFVSNLNQLANNVLRTLSPPAWSVM
jgi:hypothetical protein